MRYPACRFQHDKRHNGVCHKEYIYVNFHGVPPFDIMIALLGWKNCRNGDKKRSALPKWESGYAYLISN